MLPPMRWAKEKCPVAGVEALRPSEIERRGQSREKVNPPARRRFRRPTSDPASELVFAFALWGSSQLIYALIQLLVAFRYRSLVPLMWLLVILGTLFRELAGYLKPVHFAHTPPGAIGNYIYLPLAKLMLALGLWSGRTEEH